MNAARILAGMQIGIDARLLAYRTGGISTYITQLLRALATLHTDYEFVAFKSRKAKQSLDAPGMRIGTLWTPCHHRIERTALSVELARFRLDVLHSPDFIPPRRGARRHVITVHDLTFLHYPQHLTAESRRYYNDQIDAAVKHADHILTDSIASRDDMVSMLGVPADKISVHRLGIDARFQPQSEGELSRVRKQWNLPQSYFLFVGTFEPRKNIIGLVDAYGLLRGRNPTAPPLVIAGSRGWLYEETIAHIEQAGLGNSVVVRENLPTEDLPGLYGNALALITPSFYEGFGLPALEAMACGTLPIVSNRSSLPEVVGSVGALVEPENVDSIASALERALLDESWRAEQRTAGLARAATFRWEDTARVALSAYTRVL
ncbi:MAG: glycosyltransferase family 1 protein [Anaerolineae bacterium]